MDFSGYDVLHAHGDDYWMWRRRVPVHVRTLHGSCFEEALTVNGRQGEAAYGGPRVLRAAGVPGGRHTVVVSPATRRWVPWVRRVIPNGVDTARFHPDPGAEAERPTVLFVGTWHGRKRGAALADAFVASVRPAVPDAELLMVTQDAPPEPGPGFASWGGSTTRRWPSHTAGRGCSASRPTTRGSASRTPRRWPAVRPVVATPNLGARYVLDDGRAGELVDLPNVGSTLVALLVDADRRAVMRAAGLARARELSLSSVVDRYEELYRRPTSRQ